MAFLHPSFACDSSCLTVFSADSTIYPNLFLPNDVVTVHRKFYTQRNSENLLKHYYLKMVMVLSAHLTQLKRKKLGMNTATLR
jgi:phosphopantothenoylcysteine synthetase/decarboxylase